MYDETPVDQERFVLHFVGLILTKQHIFSKFCECEFAPGENA
jgi:hypothetical protein